MVLLDVFGHAAAVATGVCLPSIFDTKDRVYGSDVSDAEFYRDAAPGLGELRVKPVIRG